MFENTLGVRNSFITFIFKNGPLLGHISVLEFLSLH